MNRWVAMLVALSASALIGGCAVTAAVDPTAAPTQPAPTAAPATETPAPTAEATPVPEPSEEGEAVDGWVGTIVKLPPGNQFGSYFERQDGERYDIGSSDEVVREQLSELRDSGSTIKVWGRLFTGVPADQARHIEVERLEVVG